ncbi:CopG protein [hydrothermal vent metagenome]|uniref:CopG protein n=1 Tax=hydrothermal vent metagenome TaxID=652676 RepID=A0A3B0VZV9_9ZZZZ
MQKILFLFLFLISFSLVACTGLAQPDVPTQAPTQESAKLVTTSTTIHVYKSSTCGCCGDWIDRLAAYGFDLEAEDIDNMAAIKSQYSVPANMQSCHTAVVDGYIIEGHVPPADIERLLTARPDAVGLTVPGMVVGSPGMEVPDVPAQPYDVILFDESGKISLFASYNQE